MVEASGKAELVAVRVEDVEVALAPRRVARRHRRAKSSRERSLVDRVNVRDVEDRASPVRAWLVTGHEIEVEELAAGAEAGKRRLGAAVLQLEAERLV